MKQQAVKMFSNTAKKGITRLALAFLLTFIGSGAFATPPTGEEPTFKINYIGAMEEGAAFEVALVNDEKETFFFTIQDQNGVIHYKEKITARLFKKKFLWNKDDDNISSLVITVSSEKSKKAKVYEVNAQQRTMEEVVITQVD